MSKKSQGGGSGTLRGENKPGQFATDLVQEELLQSETSMHAKA